MSHSFIYNNDPPWRFTLPKYCCLRIIFLNLNLINMNLELGKNLFTSAIADTVSNSNDFSAFVCQSIEKYKVCDMGACGSEDAHQNDLSFDSGGRILSVYKNQAANGDSKPKMWIITEWDRSVTTVLYPSDY